MENKVEYIISLKDLFLKQLKQDQKAVEEFEVKFRDVAKIAAGGFVVGGLWEFGKGIAETLGKFERFDAVLTNTLGSKGEASKSMKMIEDFASKTPYEIDELTGSFVKLANMNFRPTEEQLTSIGDLAASVGKPFDQLTEAILDAQTGEFERLKEFGVKASKSGDLITFMFKGQQTTVRNTSDSIQEYILSLGKLQGVSGAMAAIAGTTDGQMSNLADSVTQLKKEFGMELKPVISTVIEGLSGFVEFMRDAVGWIGKMKPEIKALATFMGILGGGLFLYNSYLKISAVLTKLWTIEQWSLNAAMAANPVGFVIAGIAALASVVVWAWNRFEGFRGALVGAWEMMKTFAGLIKDSIIGTLKGLGDIVQGIFTFDADKINSGFKAASKGMADAVTMGMYSAYENRDKLLNSFNTGYDKGVKMGPVDLLGSAAETASSNNTKTGATKSTNPLSSGAIASKVSATKPTQIIINIDALIKGGFTVTATTVRESANQVREIIAEELMKAVNDSQRIAGI